MHEESDLITIWEAEAATGVAARLIQRWLGLGLLQRHKDPLDRRVTLIDRRELEEVIARRDRLRGGSRPRR